MHLKNQEVIVKVINANLYLRYKHKPEEEGSHLYNMLTTTKHARSCLNAGRVLVADTHSINLTLCV